MKAKLGIAPIAWWNDDLPELSGDISLEECLSEAREAGFTGMETGRRFPMDPESARADPRGARHAASAAAGSRACCSTATSSAKRTASPRRWRCSRPWTRPASSMARPRAPSRATASAPLATRRILSEDRDQGLWPQDDRLRRMVRRAGHADLLPSPHGRADRDRRTRSTS